MSKNKKCMVFETLGNVSNLEVQHINEGADDFIRLSGVFGICGIRNDNKRIYSKENYGRMVESLQNNIRTNGVLGELEHPNSMNINLDNVSHMIESIQMNEDGTVTGTIKLLNTAKGKNAQAIIEAGAPLFISSRGAGSIDESGNVTLTTIKTYDLVGTPGFSQAKLQLNENQTMKSLNENLTVIFEDDENDAASMIDNTADDKGTKEPKDDEPKDKEPKDDEPKDGENNDDEPSTEEIKKVLDYLKKEVTELKKEVKEAKENKVNYTKIQEWIMKEYTPTVVEKLGTGIQNWVVNDFTPVIEGYMKKEFAPEIQGWITNEYTPVVERWIEKEFAPVIEKYITTEFGGAINEWMVKEFAPTCQKWVVEEFAPVIDKWVTEHSNPEIKTEIVESVSDFMESKHDNALENIDKMLESIENLSTKDEAVQLLRESQTTDKYANIYAVKNMPDQYIPSWNMLSEARKEEIVNASKVYNMSKEGVLESFWANVDFNKVAKAEEPVSENKIYSTDSYVNNVIARMKAMHN